MATDDPGNSRHAAATGLFCLLLRLYPRGFRTDYSEEMMRLFREKLRDDGAHPFRFWREILADTLVSAMRERRDQMKNSTIGLTIAAVAVGVGIAWIDSRPHWDDTGITAGAILLASALFGAAGPRTPWLWALAVGSWVPAVAIARSGNYGALLALVFAFIGAYIGAGLRRAFTPPASPAGDRP